MPNEPMKPSERGAEKVSSAFIAAVCDTLSESCGSQIAATQVDRDRLLSALGHRIADATGCDEARELLRSVQFIQESELSDSHCVYCQRFRRVGCAPDCRLAAYLKKYGGSTHEQA